MKRMQPMWVALDKRGRIQATWYAECVQSFRSWRKAIKSLGYSPVRAEIIFRVR